MAEPNEPVIIPLFKINRDNRGYWIEGFLKDDRGRRHLKQLGPFKKKKAAEAVLYEWTGQKQPETATA